MIDDIYSDPNQDYSYADAPAAPYVPDGYEPGDFSNNASQIADALSEALGVTGIDIGNFGIDGLTTGDFSRLDRATQGLDPGQAPTTGDFARADRASGEGGSDMASKFSSFLTGTGDFLSKYKGPLEMLGRGVAAAAKSKSDQEAAQKLADSRIAELNAADQLKQQAQGRYSASVSGLRGPIGLINQGRLQRTDGTNVFAGNGLINRS